jgi:hypothetical protein
MSSCGLKPIAHVRNARMLFFSTTNFFSNFHVKLSKKAFTIAVLSCARSMTGRLDRNGILAWEDRHYVWLVITTHQHVTHVTPVTTWPNTKQSNQHCGYCQQFDRLIHHYMVVCVYWPDNSQHGVESRRVGSLSLFGGSRHAFSTGHSEQTSFIWWDLNIYCSHNVHPNLHWSSSTTYVTQTWWAEIFSQYVNFV